MLNEETIKSAARIISQADCMVVLTGAGMSVDSGVNDFRSRSGWWRQIDPRTVATVEALERNYELFHAFYKARIEQLEHVHPHPGHGALKKWEQAGMLQLIATQNVDGLHQRAGNNQVEELHGSILSYRCHHCGKDADKQQFLLGHRCSCGGRLRPNVVLFGETLPQNAWQRSLEAIDAADVVLVIGTSLEVYPVSQLPAMTKGKTILINKEPVGSNHSFDLVVMGKAADALTAIDSWVNIE